MIKKIEYSIRKFLLRVLSWLSRKTKSSSDKIKINSDTKCLIIRINRIGDALVTTPFIHLLKQKTCCNISVLADRKNYFAFNNNPDIDEIMIYDKGLKGFFQTLKVINSRNFDIVIDAHDDVSTTVSFLISAIRCNYKLGLEKSNKSIFTHTTPRPDANKYHVTERICSLLKILEINYSKEEIKIIYNPTESSINKIKESFENIFHRNKFLLGINISAGSDARFWGTENFRLLINKLSEYDINIILICHQKDFDKAKKIIDEKFIFNPTNDFDLFAAVIQNLNMLFTPDTSAVFLADAKGITVFELFVKYQMDEIIWHPINSEFDCVITEEPTLHNIEFEQVWKKFLPFFEKHLKLYNELLK